MNELDLPWVPALASAIVQFVWQGAVVGVVTLLLIRLLPRPNPHARYLVYCIAMVACAIVLVGNFTLALIAHSASVPEVDYTRSAMTNGSTMMGLLGGKKILASGLSLAIVAIWAIGVSFLFVRIALSTFWIQRMRQAPQSSQQPIWQARLDILAQRFGLKQKIQLCFAGDLSSPICAGWWRPVVFLPTALITRMAPELIEVLLAHELAHIRRHDYLVKTVQSIIEALLFFHPVIWWLTRNIDQEREQMADALAAKMTDQPKHLACALAALAEYHGEGSLPTLAQAATGGHLMTRIKLLVKPSDHRVRTTVWTQLGAALILLVVVFGVAQVALANIEPVRISYALVRLDKSPLLSWGPDDDIHIAAAAVHGIAVDFIFVRRAGVERVITDPDIVAPLRARWSKVYQIEEQLSELDRQLIKQPFSATLNLQRAALARQQAEVFGHTERYLQQVVAPIAASKALNSTR